MKAGSDAAIAARFAVISMALSSFASVGSSWLTYDFSEGRAKSWRLFATVDCNHLHFRQHRLRSRVHADVLKGADLGLAVHVRLPGEDEDLQRFLCRHGTGDCEPRGHQESGNELQCVFCSCRASTMGAARNERLHGPRSHAVEPQPTREPRVPRSPGAGDSNWRTMPEWTGGFLHWPMMALSVLFGNAWSAYFLAVLTTKSDTTREFHRHQQSCAASGFVVLYSGARLRGKDRA